MAFVVNTTTVIDSNRRQQNLRLTTSVITASATAVAGTHYYLNGSNITLTLPASPVAGDQVGISEVAGNVNNTIARNAQNIMSLAENLILDRRYGSFILVFVDATRGWVFN
jgi:hypothetical protein